ncbi:MAG: DUF1178 family protein [Alphaproteobacteria bacterium]|nr:DUF1178 family protein [Alphaproteobacteria bacterium]
MILFTVHCANGHEFEAWFRDNDGFDVQRAGGEIVCPMCGDTSVEKAVMAPRLARMRDGAPAAALLEMRKALVEMRRQIEAHCDYVGPRFAEEARRIHYGEIDPRGIYGEATDKESRALADEGIQFGQIPWVPQTDG